MRDVLPTLAGWAESGHRFAMATVIHTWGSSPRPVGSIMGVREDGAVCGSVSGGCVEAAVIAEALEALKSGKSKELDFGQLSDSAAWEVGLSCGGRIKVLVQPEPPFVPKMLDAVVKDRPLVIRTNLDTYQSQICSVDEPGSIESGEVEVAGERIFIQVLAPRDRMIIIGAVHIAIPLIKFASELGFETILVDPRTALAEGARFEGVDRIVSEWPETALQSLSLTKSTYVVTLTHDPKFDDVALAAALQSEAAYIGALGSKTTHARRLKELASQGFSEEQLARIHGPVGLKIGALTPAEIALSIVAEMVQVRNGRR